LEPQFIISARKVISMWKPLLKPSQVYEMNLEPVKPMTTEWFSLCKHEHTSSNIVACT